MPMKALVTGSRGFVGRHMVRALLDRGWDVTGCDIATRPSITLPEDDALYRFQRSSTRYDLVVHAAASSPHRAAIDGEPVHFARNLQLDAAMFDWAVRTRQGRVIYLSSASVYPVGLQDDFATARALREDDVQWNWRNVGTPDAVYGWTKLTGERLAEQARKAGLKVTVVRPMSGYGEDQSENFPFRAIIERARRREDPFVIWGSGVQVRDWIHIDDCVNGMLAIAESDTEDPVNLGTGIGTSMTELAEMACAQVGYKPTVTPLPDKPAGVAYRVADPSRFLTYHQPRISLEEGVARALKENRG